MTSLCPLKHAPPKIGKEKTEVPFRAEEEKERARGRGMRSWASRLLPIRGLSIARIDNSNAGRMQPLQSSSSWNQLREEHSPSAGGEAGKETMKDEYGNMDAAGETFIAPNFTLESGRQLKQVAVRYNTFGRLNERKDNVLVVCHALTGNARLDSWWSSILGPQKPFDTDRYMVVCANILGSCYGTTGPSSINPETGERYGTSFPQVTVRDTINLHYKMLREGLGIQRVACVIGGSLGGMQALEWLFAGGPSFIGSAVAIACGARHTAWQIGVSETQRQAIYADPNWRDGNFPLDQPPSNGLSVARQIAMFSYRTPQGFESKFGREVGPDKKWQVRRYLEYQGQKFLTRFDALTYVRLTEKMDTHDVGRGRGGVEAALRSVAQPVMVMGIDSDILYPLSEQQELVRHIPDSELVVVRSNDGHDGFLLEQEQVGSAIRRFLERVSSSSRFPQHTETAESSRL